MINAVFFGINIILLIAVWNFMLKKTILDHYRDQLFDLREEVRDYFLENGIPLDSSAYKNLRNLLNGHLRFTERFNFLKFVILEVEVRNNSQLESHLKSEIDKSFKTNDPRLKEFVPQVRERAKAILLNYMINSSGTMWVFAFVISPFVIAWNLLKGLKFLLKAGFSVLTDGIFYSVNEAFKFVFTINAPFRKTVKKDLLEECSYQIGAEHMLVGC